MRVLVLTAALCLTALSNGHQPVRFVHPKRTIVLAGASGRVDIPIQAWVEPHASNRAFDIQWVTDNGDDGRCCVRQLEGEFERALQPIEPIRLRVSAGVYRFVASAYDGSGKRRASGELTVTVQ